ncbi:hypothetical protein, partial [Gilliamella apis]|uniref:hypothetical protein n=1 Tax=Gilliamella apis TaxID=1970738 RepID=UPI000B63F29C
DNPGRINRISLPQTFELVGRDSSGNAVVKYGFVLKQWFVNRGFDRYTYSSVESWCNKIGYYRVPDVKDLTNASCRGYERCQGATPSSGVNYFSHHIGAGFFTEWGRMDSYRGANFKERGYYWTSGVSSYNTHYEVRSYDGEISFSYNSNVLKEYGLCVYP